MAICMNQVALSVLSAGLFVGFLAAPEAEARRAVLPGPVQAVVEQVVDGDTVRARATIWLDQEVRITIRLRGVDTPEMNGRCPRESALARKARRFTQDALRRGAISLTDIRRGKYGGRVVARIANARGEDLGDALLKAGLARPYTNRRRSWCQVAAPHMR